MKLGRILRLLGPVGQTGKTCVRGRATFWSMLPTRSRDLVRSASGASTTFVSLTTEISAKNSSLARFPRTWMVLALAVPSS